MKCVTFNNEQLKLDLNNRHERDYYDYIINNKRYPLIDLDDKLYEKFIKRDDRILDGGANIGFAALQMLKYNPSKIFCFEPVKSIFDRLSEIKSDKIIKFNEALSDKSGTVEITISSTHDQGSSINSTMVEYASNVFKNSIKQKAKTVTIDAYAKNSFYFDIWKLDLEGAEIEALKGGNTVLSSSPPRCIIAELYPPFFKEFDEIATKTHPFRYRALIRKNDYSLQLLDIEQKIDYNVYYKISPTYVYLLRNKNEYGYI